MTRQSLRLRILALFFLVCSFDAQNTKLSLQGVVLEPERDSPVSKATIELFDSNLRRVVARGATTADGKFDFRNLQAGIYRLVITRSGFVPWENAALVLAPTTPPTPLRILMTPTGTITGRVTDRGQPLVLADVFALKSTYNGAQRVMTVVQSTKTNVRGEYRLFWLPPGRYSVSATGASSFGASNTVLQQGGDNASIYSERLTSRTALTRAIGNGLSDGQTYMPTFFPGTLDAQAAAVIDLRGGAEVRNIDIDAPARQTYRVSGVLGGTPLPLEQTGGGTAPVFPYATLYSLGAILTGTPTANATNLTIRGFRIGTFEFPNVAPGRYLVQVTGGHLSGQSTIEVFDSDVKATIDMRTGFDVSGRIIVDGPPAILPALRVLLRNEISSPRYASDAPQANGNFTVSSVMAGNYRLFVIPVLRPVAEGAALTPMPVYVKSVRLGDRDVLRDGIEVNAGLEGQTRDRRRHQAGIIDRRR